MTKYKAIGWVVRHGEAIAVDEAATLKSGAIRKWDQWVRSRLLPRYQEEMLYKAIKAKGSGDVVRVYVKGVE